jgi:hypothetical protein
MGKSLFRKLATFAIIFVLASSFTVAIAAAVNARHPYSDVVMSMEEILNDINERLGSDIQAVHRPGDLHPSEMFFSGRQLQRLMEFHESTAIRVLEGNAIANRNWYESTGIPIEDIMCHPELNVVRDFRNWGRGPCACTHIQFTSPCRWCN